MNKINLRTALAASVALAISMAGVHAQNAPNAGDADSRVAASALTTTGGYNRFIISYRNTAPASGAAVAQAASVAITQATRVQASLAASAPMVKYARQMATGAHVVTTTRKLSASEAAAFMQSVAADPAVAYVEPDIERHAVGLSVNDFMPDDPYFASYQTDFLPGDGTPTTTNKVPNWGGANITGAWQLADGTGITIAVLDSGIVKHADLDTSLGDAGYDFLSDSKHSGRPTDGRAPGGWDLGDWTTGAPYSSGPDACTTPAAAHSSSWHGMHVAGTAGAEITNNKLGLAGVAYHAKVLPVRVLGHCGGLTSDIADGIVWAAGGHVDGVPDNTHPAQVINMSLGGPGSCDPNSVTARAIASARARGAAILVAAGNESSPASASNPGNCAGVITVGAVGVGSGMAWYSNYNRPGESVVKLAAFGGGMYVNDGSSGQDLSPEGSVWQAVNNGTTTPIAGPAGDNYKSKAGTSQATPHVAGTVALMQSARLAAGLPLLTPDGVLNVLQRTARTPHTAPDPTRTFGAGILDAAAAVAAAVAPPVPYVTTLLNGMAMTGQSGSAGSEAFYRIDVPANARALAIRTAGGSGDVSLYVKAGALPTGTSYDYGSAHVGNAESVTVPRVAMATTYYLRVVGVLDYSGVSVQATYTP